MTKLCAGNEKKEYDNINFGQLWVEGGQGRIKFRMTFASRVPSLFCTLFTVKTQKKYVF